MSGLLGVAVLLLVAFALSVLWNKPPEETLPFAIFTTILFLYAFYCMNLLPVGKWALRAVFLGVVLYGLRVAYKRKLSLSKLAPRCLTPAISLFIVLSLVFYFYTRDNLVGLWDELRLWGAVPKILHYEECLQLGADATTFQNMQSYPPGMALFIYYLSSYSPAFSENVLFFGYAVFGAMLFLPAIQKLTWKQWPLFAPILLIVIVLPCVFTNVDFDFYYESLFIDVPLGLAVGYLLYAAARGPSKSRFATASFAAAACVLVLLKDSGALFAFAILVCDCVLALTERTSAVPRSPRFVFRAALPLLAALVCFAVWQLLLLKFGVKNHAL